MLGMNLKNYKNEKKDGLLEYFDEEGNLTETQEWKDGDGNLTETKEYKDGELIE